MNDLQLGIGSGDMSDQRLRRKATAFVVLMTLTFAVLLGLVGLWGLQNADVVRQRAELRTLELQQAAGLYARAREARTQLWRVGRRLREGRDQSEPEEFAERVKRAEEALRLVNPPLDHPALVQQWALAERKSSAFLRDAEAMASAGNIERDRLAIEEQLEGARDELRRISAVAEQVAHQRADALTERALSLQRRSLFLVILCAILSVIGSVVSLRFVRNLFDRLSDSQKAMTRVSGQLIEKQEVAARKFSQELHDELGQNLTALKSHLAILGPSLDPDDFQDRKKRVLAILDDSIATTRNLSQLMHPRVLDDLGLPAALEWLADGVSDRVGIAVECQVELSRRLEPGLRHQIFRIAQEALTNTARHSGATTARITLSDQGDATARTIVLCVTDNGKGLPSLSLPSQGLGVAGMRARALMVGGILTVSANRPQGLRLEVTAPAAYEDEYTQDHGSAGG